MTSTSVHVLRFEDARSWDDLRTGRPAAATYWHPGVTAVRDPAGVPVPDLRSWTVLACWEQREDWVRAVDGPGPWQDASEAWSALLEPGPTRDLPAPPQWAEGRTTPPFGAPVSGPLLGQVAVVTTVGLSPDDLGAVLRFARDVEDVVDTLAAAPGSQGFRLGSAEHFPSQADAFTFSLWADARSARAWAYQAGVHARAVEAHMQGAHVTRGSFTTLRVVETRGTWSDRHVHRRQDAVV